MYLSADVKRPLGAVVRNEIQHYYLLSLILFTLELLLIFIYRCMQFSKYISTQTTACIIRCISLLLIAVTATKIYGQDKIVYYDNTITLGKVTLITDAIVQFVPQDSSQAESISRKRVALIQFVDGRIEVMNRTDTLKIDYFQNEYEKYRLKMRKVNRPERNALGVDVFSLFPMLNSFSLNNGIANSSVRIMYERKNKTLKLAHILSSQVIWIGAENSTGSFNVAYATKFFFNRHRYVRGFVSAEAGLGYGLSYLFSSSYFPYEQVQVQVQVLHPHTGANFGFNYTGKEHFFLSVECGLGLTYPFIIRKNLFPSSKYIFTFPLHYRIGVVLGGVFDNVLNKKR